MASSPRLEILHWPSRIADNDGVWFDILDDHRPHSNHGPFADADSFADTRSSADFDTGTNLNIPRHSNERSKGYEVADTHIMPNRAVEISDEVHADGGHYRHSNAGNDHRSWRDVYGWVAWSFNINCRKSGGELLNPRGKKPPRSGGAHSDYAVHLGPALVEGSQDWPAISRGGPRYPIIEKPRNRKGLRASFGSKGDLASESARPNNDQGTRSHCRSLSCLRPSERRHRRVP